MSRERASITKIAEEFGINTSTVSRALNDKPGVSAKLRTKIKRRAQKLNYRPNPYARILLTHKTGMIGVVGAAGKDSLLDNPFWGRIIAGIELSAHEHGYDMAFSNLGTFAENDEMTHLPGFLERRRVDGLIIVSATTPTILEFIRQEGLPAAIVDSAEPSGYDSIVVAQEKAARVAAQHLLSLGHREIAFFGTPHRHPNIMKRRNGVKNEVLENGGTFRELSRKITDKMVDDSSRQFDALIELFKTYPGITAVAFENDYAAFSTHSRLTKIGIHAPTDISIIGFDDLLFSADLEPPLTTIRVPKRLMGRAAFENVYARLQGDEEVRKAPPQTRSFEGELTVRETTGKPRNYAKLSI